MQIIPVIDLKNGLVVRGIAGRREEYRPIESKIAASASPGDVAAAFAQRGYRIVYVADLDAIAGAPPDGRSYEQIAAAGLKLWIDAGAGDASRANKLINVDYCEAAILGLESLASPDALNEITAAIGTARTIFSLDLKDGVPLTNIAVWQRAAPLEIVRAAVATGIERMIVLDLAAVGTNQGPASLSLAREIRREFPQLSLIGGGGVRDAADLAGLEEAGYSAALVASALHDGKLGDQASQSITRNSCIR